MAVTYTKDSNYCIEKSKYPSKQANELIINVIRRETSKNANKKKANKYV